MFMPEIPEGSSGRQMNIQSQLSAQTSSSRPEEVTLQRCQPPLHTMPNNTTMRCNPVSYNSLLLSVCRLPEMKQESPQSGPETPNLRPLHCLMGGFWQRMELVGRMHSIALHVDTERRQCRHALSSSSILCTEQLLEGDTLYPSLPTSTLKKAMSYCA